MLLFFCSCQARFISRAICPCQRTRINAPPTPSVAQTTSHCSPQSGRRSPTSAQSCRSPTTRAQTGMRVLSIRRSAFVPLTITYFSHKSKHNFLRINHTYENPQVFRTSVEWPQERNPVSLFRPRTERPIVIPHGNVFVSIGRQNVAQSGAHRKWLRNPAAH